MDHVARVLSWDLSPLRPWEYWQQDAREWQEAVAIQQAWKDGYADATDEAAASGAITVERSSRV